MLIPIIKRIAHWLIFGNGESCPKPAKEPTSAARFEQIEADILALATAIDVIRNKVLRKIQFKKTEEATEAQDLNTNAHIRSGKYMFGGQNGQS